MAPGSAQPTYLASDASIVFARWNNLLVGACHTPELPSTFELLERHATEMSLRNPAGFGYLVIVMHEERPPSGYVEIMARLAREFGVVLRAGGAVFEAKGFAAATQRSVGTALIHAVGRAKQFKLVSSVAEAAPWFSSQLGETCPPARDAAALLEVLEDVRRHPTP